MSLTKAQNQNINKMITNIISSNKILAFFIIEKINLSLISNRFRIWLHHFFSLHLKPSQVLDQDRTVYMPLKGMGATIASFVW